MREENHSEKNLLLKKYFGYDTFRPLQEDIIETVLNREDAFVLMPTGGGKSLCYQIPALMMKPGVTIVVSPLISLMEDQVAALTLLGIEASAYHTSISSEEARHILKKLHDGTLDLLYISPERLLSPNFMERLMNCEISLFAIDEAHCISQWGHDFRPEYHALNLLKENFQNTPIIALTATADELTRKDIIQKLNIHPRVFIDSFNRPNIFYRVILKNNPIKQISDFLKTKKDEAGIIYCNTRDSVDKVATKLQSLGFSARAYHAGLDKKERSEVQALFRDDKIQLIVATIAFGMGINKPNVRFVIHHDLPKTLENYYQETGRAGRDGLPSEAFLLYCPSDAARVRGFISALPNTEDERLNLSRLHHMSAFAESSSCRRRVLLNYFGEAYEKECGHCDTCQNPPEKRDVTLEAQQFLSAIYRQRQSYGLLHTINVLRGSQTEKIKEVGHHRLSTYGIGKEHSEFWWRRLGWQLIHQGYCRQDMSSFNVLKLEKKALLVLKGEEHVFMAIPKETVSTKSQKSDKKYEEPSPLFVALKKVRREIAEEESKPPFVIFSDATLREMVREKPKTLTELLNVSGVGQFKLMRYGERFLEVIKKNEEVVV